MSVAAPLVLREGDQSRLESLTRSSSVRAGLALRARIVLLAAEGLPNAEIARRCGVSRPTVVGRFSQWKHVTRRVRRISRRASSSCESYGVGR